MLANRFLAALGVLLLGHAGAAAWADSHCPTAWRGTFCALFFSSREYPARARQQLWLTDSGDVSAAVAASQFTLLQDPASAFRWCDLGEAYVLSGDAQRAGFCYRRAVELAPRVPPVLLRAAGYSMSAGRDAAAWPLLAAVLGSVREYDEWIFSLYSQTGLDPGLLFEHALPLKAAPAQAYFQYLLRRRDAGNLAKLWAWLQKNGLTGDQAPADYLQFLIAARQYDVAAEVQAQWLGAAAPGIQPVLRGGFETPPTRSPLDWQVVENPHFRAARDSRLPCQGERSLRIQFDGRENLKFGHLRQKVIVPPGRWRLQGHLRTEALTTDKGVGFRIFDVDRPGQLDLWTPAVTGTSDWQAFDLSFTVARTTCLLEIRVVRQPSRKLDNKLGGAVWVDDVSLTPGI